MVQGPNGTRLLKPGKRQHVQLGSGRCCPATYRSISGSGSTQPSATGHLSSASVSCSADQRDEKQHLGLGIYRQLFGLGLDAAQHYLACG
jgi:hypothetical protein